MSRSGAVATRLKVALASLEADSRLLRVPMTPGFVL
jgi:hypothetical protein